MRRRGAGLLMLLVASSWGAASALSTAACGGASEGRTGTATGGAGGHAATGGAGGGGAHAATGGEGPVTSGDAAADVTTDTAIDAPTAADAGPDGPTGVPYDPSYLRVSAYGAVGDGVHDDRPAIQAAMDAAKAMNGTVYFDPGTYLLASSTNGTDGQLFESDFGSGFTLNLYGNQATLVTAQDQGSLLHAQGAWQKSAIKGLTFASTHGVTTNQTVAIFLEGTNADLIHNWTIQGDAFKNFSTFIMTTGVDQVLVDGDDFVMEQGRDSGAGTDGAMPTVGIWLLDNAPNDGTSTNVTITNNHYDGCGSLTDLGQTVSRSCGDGFVFGRSFGTLVQGNTIRGFSAESIFIIQDPAAGAPVTVQDNDIDGTMIPGDQFGGGLWGVRADANGTIVKHNTIKNAVTGIFSCGATGCGGTGTPSTGIQVSDNTITTDASGAQTLSVGIQMIGVVSSSITGNTITFHSGTVAANAEAYGISLSGASSTSTADSLTVTGNMLTDALPSQGGGVAGIFMQWSSNWAITGNTITGFSYGFDCLNQPGTMAELQALLSGNTLVNDGTPDRLQNGSF